MSKNNVRGSFDEFIIDDTFMIIKFQNDTDETQNIVKDVNCNYIQFHYAIKGSGLFSFNEGAYKLPLKGETSLLLYNPNRDLPMNLEVAPNSWLITLLVPIKKFHSLFSAEANYVPFLSDEYRDKKYYHDSPISPSMAVVLNQLMNFNIHSSLKGLYYKAKAYELMSLHFNQPEDADIEQCPFLADELNVQKIKKAKDIIIARMTEPPTLQELSTEINLPLKKLKDGFKQIYGEPVFTFLYDYKMEMACKLLAEGNNVNEVGLKLGYSTSSHFIAAFKKKYGVTPKKYVKN